MENTLDSSSQMPSSTLPQRALGNTGIEVSILGLGTVKLGRNEGVKYPDTFAIPDDRSAQALLTLARDKGINLIDTAPAYGTSEQRLGKLLQGQREHWIICSKVGEEFTEGESHYHFGPAHTRSSIERSLQRLNTEVLDIVLVHSDGNDAAIINDYGTLQVLAEMKQEGKIRSFGMSTKTVSGGLLAAEQCDVVMVTWNLAYNDEIPVIDRCLELNKGVLIKKALASGHTTLGQISSSQSSASQSDKSVNDKPVNDSPGDPVASTFKTLLGHQGVSSIIIGSINPEHIRSNIDAAIAASP